MKKQRIIEVISALLISLFIYAAVSKLLVFNQFKGELYNQPIPYWGAEILVWLLPLAELIAAGLLLSSSTRLWGLYSSGFLMLVFTVYVGLVLSNSFGRIPCSCGGILKNMGWVVHLVFNIFFLLLAIAGIILFKIKQRMQEKTFSSIV